MFTVVTTISELIDTLWNVNVLSHTKACLLFYELIDTLWNVNDDMDAFAELLWRN